MSANRQTIVTSAAPAARKSIKAGRRRNASELANGVEALERRQLLSAATISVVGNFNTSTIQSGSEHVVEDSAGNIYGVTGGGGAVSENYPPGWGTIFEIPAGSNTIKMLYEFEPTGLYRPSGSLAIDGAGNLYGTSEFGGAYGHGAVFELPANSKSIITLASFENSGMMEPTAFICDAAGNLYGATLYDASGVNFGGTVFEISATTRAFSTIATFTGTNGSGPTSLVLDAAGNLYGTTAQGGDLTTNRGFGDGTVFEIATGTDTLTTLATFNGPNGSEPNALVVGPDGNLYGTTNNGGDLAVNNGIGGEAAGDGTVFEISSTTHQLTTLVAFDGTAGVTPDALLVDAKGDLFGSTWAGGDYSLMTADNVGMGLGTIFEVPAGTNTLDTIHTFEYTDGDMPILAFSNASGDLFGTTFMGGNSNFGQYENDNSHGVVFEITGSDFVSDSSSASISTSGGSESDIGGSSSDAGSDPADGTGSGSVDAGQSAASGVSASNDSSGSSSAAGSNFSGGTATGSGDAGSSGAGPVTGAPTSPLALLSNAHASAGTITGKTRLMVLGSTSETGASPLIYTWMVVKAPSGAKSPNFSANGTSDSNSIIATFSKDGTYHLRCVISGSDGKVVASDVSVTVAQVATSLRVTPHRQIIHARQTLQFQSVVLDQFGHLMRSASSAIYSIFNGAGTIGVNSGLFTATKKKGHVVIDIEEDSLLASVTAMVT